MSTAASPQASEAPPPLRRWAVVVMGVSGCGKSTVAEGIAAALRLACIDGDHLHSPEAVAKMAAGTPLTDDDRWPWLDRIGARLADAAAAPAGLVVSCSALRRVYRDRLRRAAPELRFVFLDGAPGLIRDRMQARKGHYMPTGLLDSQLRTLERPAADERGVVTVNIDATPEEIVRGAVVALQRNLAS